ncbi:sugar-binding protein [Paenibacillus harenae]|uniref:sugar-binding protein n=1 Tax=Paenibacillus harenae TaxID=306543 RepID=UPI0004264E89|nr:sugar-binding protein [Paenibacillus harenae]
MKKLFLLVLMVTLTLGQFTSLGFSTDKAYAADSSIYEAEAAENIRVSSDVETLGGGAAYSGTGFVKLGAKSDSASMTWPSVTAPADGNYVLTFHYSNNNQTPRPFALKVNDQYITTFQGEQTGANTAPTWAPITAVVMLNQGTNKVTVTSESENGPEIDYLGMKPYDIIFEAETGAGAAHVNNSFGNNAVNAPGFTGTGYVGIAASSNGYLQWNNVVVPEDGTYTIRFRYNLGNTARPGQVTVNGEQTFLLQGLSTGGWNIWKFEEISGVELTAGTNTLKLQPNPASGPLGNYDRIEIYNESPIQIGNQVFRTTTFETSDPDPMIAAAETGSVIQTPLLNGTTIDSASDTTARIVEEDGDRWAEVTTAAAKKGIIAIPFHANGLTAVKMNSYTLEKTVKLIDLNADYIFHLTNASGSIKSPIYVISRDGKIYARSNNTAAGALTERAVWNENEAVKIKLVFHVDTQSYDMFINDSQVVSSEPIQSDPYIGGLQTFYLAVKDGPHLASTILLDDIELSGSIAAGTAPVTNPNPGAPYVESPYIGDPVNYYVSPNGSDLSNGLTPENSFLTIQKAASLTQPGDTVYVMSGTYRATAHSDRWLNITRSGAYDQVNQEAKYITYTAYDPNNKPKLLLPDNVPGVWNMVAIAANYIIFDGFEVEGNNLNLTLEQGEAVYEDKIAGGTNWAEYARTNTNGIDFNGHHIIARNNHVHHMAGGGIGGKGDYITIENNEIHSNSWYTMYATSGVSFLGNYDVDSNTTDYKIIIRNNRVYDNETKVKWDRTMNYSDGNGIIYDVNQEYKGRTLITNNIVYENGGSGIHTYRSMNVDIINNTVYNNSRSPHMNYANLFANASENINILNNIVYGRAGKPINDDISGYNNVFANNVYFNGVVKVMGTNDRVLDPKFVSLEAGNYDFHLQSDSPAIDYGTQTRAPQTDYAGDARPQGAKYDIGAYETPYTSENPIENDVIVIVEPQPDVTQQMEAAYGTPEMDGDIDAIWATTPSVETSKLFDANKPAAIATVRALWDENNLYVLAEVADPHLSSASSNVWEQDSVELFLDENNAKSDTFGSDDGHYRVNFENLRSGSTKGKNTSSPDSFETATSIDDGGYIVEARLPLTTIDGVIGKILGFEAQVNDDGNGDGVRDNVAKWNNQKNDSHLTTVRWGEVKLVAGGDTGAAQVTDTLSGPAVVRSGDEFKLTYGIVNDDGAEVFVEDLTITYDANAMEILDVVSLKTGFEVAGWSTSEPGKLRILGASAGPSGAVTTSGDLFEITVRASAVSAPTNVVLRTDSTLLNPANEIIVSDAAVLELLVTNQIPGDVNGPGNTADGKVDIHDLLFVSLHYGKNSGSADWEQVKHADLSGDSAIGIEDLSAVAQLILQ